LLGGFSFENPDLIEISKITTDRRWILLVWTSRRHRSLLIMILEGHHLRANLTQKWEPRLEGFEIRWMLVINNSYFSTKTYFTNMRLLCLLCISHFNNFRQDIFFL
jgi:hypothetical protein